MTQTTQALTNSVTIVGLLPARAAVMNMIGQPENPALVLRCRENILAAYIAWPQVLKMDAATFRGRPQTMILWRVDDNPIAANYWLTSDDGTATGMFETKQAAKLLEKLVVAKRLAVRLTGTSTQDAEFHLADIKAVAARIGAPCGVKWTITP